MLEQRIMIWCRTISTYPQKLESSNISLDDGDEFNIYIVIGNFSFAYKSKSIALTYDMDK